MTATTSKRETRKTGRREDGRAHRLGIPNAPMPRKGDVACFFACHVFLPATFFCLPRVLNPKWSKHRNSLPFFFFLSQTLHSAKNGGNFSAAENDSRRSRTLSPANQLERLRRRWRRRSPEELKANAKEDADAAARQPPPSRRSRIRQKSGAA